MGQVGRVHSLWASGTPPVQVEDAKVSDPQTAGLNGSWAPRNPCPGWSPVWGGRSQQNVPARAGKTCLALGAWASIKLFINNQSVSILSPCLGGIRWYPHVCHFIFIYLAFTLMGNKFIQSPSGWRGTGTRRRPHGGFTWAPPGCLGVLQGSFQHQEQQ